MAKSKQKHLEKISVNMGMEKSGPLYNDYCKIPSSNAARTKFYTQLPCDLAISF